MRDVETIVMSPAFRRLRNQLCLLRSFELEELERAGVITGGRIEFRGLESDPIAFFQRLDDARAAALFRLMEERLAADLRADAEAI